MPGGHNRLLHPENESGSSNAKLWRNADFRKFQKHPSIPTLLDFDQCQQSQEMLLIWLKEY